jgi:1,2-dihydroxy-3-keto-5-methylthiopentene dioxygenase
MATVRVPQEGRAGRVFGDPASIARELAGLGIDYERVDVPAEIAAAPAARVLESYEGELAKLRARGGYVTADVIDVTPATPGLEAMLAKFSREHWHDEDEIRLIVSGKGIFHIHPKDGPVVAIEVEAGDLIRVPAGTRHWFDLCDTRTIRAIRLFRDPAGWVPRYTESGAESGFQPICMGPPRPVLGNDGG